MVLRICAEYTLSPRIQTGFKEFVSLPKMRYFLNFLRYVFHALSRRHTTSLGTSSSDDDDDASENVRKIAFSKTLALQGSARALSTLVHFPACRPLQNNDVK